MHKELAAVRPENADPDAFVFLTTRCYRLSSNSVERVLARASERANVDLAKRRLPMLPKLTPHSRRRTFASILYALGESPVVVMQEMGHERPEEALAIYAKIMRRSDDESAQLRSLVEGVWANDWANEPATAPDSVS